MTHTEPSCNEVVNQPNASRLHWDARLGGGNCALPCGGAWPENWETGAAGSRW